MNVRLPIWLQTFALFALAGILVLAVLWVEEQGKHESMGRSGVVANSVHGLLFVAMPLPVLILGIRLFFEIVGELKVAPAGAYVYWFLLLIVMTLVAVLSLAPFTPLKQVAR